MDLEDCAGFDDSDVAFPESGLIGPVNCSLMPRFEQPAKDDRNATISSSTANKGASKRRTAVQLSAGGRRASGRLMSPTQVPEEAGAQTTQTMLKVPMSSIIQRKFRVVEDHLG